MKSIKGIEIDATKYPTMYEHVHEIPPFSGKLVAKDQAVEALFATYEDPVVSNAILLAPPGTGKTTLMKGLAYQDKKHIYIEAELSEMVTGLRDNAEMGSVVKNLFNEIAEFGKEHKVKVVIFVDEFHQLINYSPVVAEAFKPVLAESGRKGLRLVVATTYEEFRRDIMPNQALVERLQRVSLPQPRYEDVIWALESLAKEEGITITKEVEQLFDTIFRVTEQYMPAANQPRKSVLTFSRMIGYHRAHNRPLGFDLLAHTLRNGQNVEIDMRVDLDAMENHMRTNILDQKEAIDSFMDSIAMSVMKMNADDKPRGSWLMLGPTGVGKALTDDTMIPTLGDNGQFVMKRNGDLVVGDKVFNRKGEPVSILGVYPQGKRKIYRVTFEDGRIVDSSSEHLWTVYRVHDSGYVMKYDKETITSQQLYDRQSMVKYATPSNKALRCCDCHIKSLDFELVDVLDEIGDELSIKPEYKYAAIKIRQRLIQLLFDVDGHIDDFYNLKYTVYSETLVRDVQDVLWSLGFSSTLESIVHDDQFTSYTLNMNVKASDKLSLFDVPLNFDLDILRLHVDKTHYYDDSEFDYVGIRSIEILDDEVPMTCIYIDDDEHLYQTANGIVTHNTELTKQAASYLFADPNAFLRFDMTEYVNADSVDRFRQLVTARMWEYPFSILLFDEIEKANGNVVRLLMQILDDGRLVDANDRVVNFSNAYIFGTSNLGSEIFESASQYGDESRSYKRNVKKSITETSKDGGFPPELVNRFDTLVPFKPLSRQTMIALMYMKCQKILNKFYKEQRVKVFIGERILDAYLGHDIIDDDTEAGAGRQVNRVLQDYITKPVSTYIYHHPNEDSVYLELDGDTVYGNKHIIDSTAEIKIMNRREWLVSKWGKGKR